VKLGPGGGGSDIDGGVLPDHALGPAQAAAGEAVHLHSMARAIGLDVEHRKGLPRLRLWRRGVTGDPTQALGPGVETVAFEHTPDAVAGDPEAAPLGPAELQAQTVGPPGLARAKARTRCSTMGEIAFGIRGRRRSRGRKISVPKRTGCRCQR
jgi:hypothetical protein